MRRKRFALITAAASLLLGLPLSASTAPASAAPGEVLILDSTVTGGAGSTLANKFIMAGKTPVVVSAATWSSMTAAQFDAYDAIVLGDPTCRARGPEAAATANAAVWSSVVDGNVVVIGTDETFHQGSGGAALMEKAAAFSVAKPGKTGAYISLSCYYHGTAAGTPVPLLSGLGSFTATGVGCYNNAHIVASHPALTGLTDATLSNWSCSVHEGFDSWPLSFEVLAMARGIGASYTAPDGSVGTPYILARGVEVISDIKLTPATATNDVGTSHTLTATVTKDDPAPGTPIVGTTVTFTVVAGPHTGTTGTGVTDAVGVATFTYTGTIVGTDTIEATFVDGSGRAQRSNRVEKIWEERAPDLSITKTDDVDPVMVGSNLTYTVTAKNNGPAVATGVVVTDTLPAGVTLLSAIPSQGTCGLPTVTCNLGTLPSMASATVAIKVAVGPSAAPGITNSASVKGNETDPVPANNTASERTVVTPVTDLSVTKTDDVDPVAVGATLTYTVTATNGGPSPATGVVVTDTLPAGVTLVSAIPSQGTCGVPTVTCNLGTLPSMASATVAIKVTPTAGGTITNKASIKGNEFDPKPANNTATATTKVQPRIAINDVSVVEGDPPMLTPATFTVSLSAPSADPITVAYATAAGTATASPALLPLIADYTTTSGTVTFNPGETTKPVTVQVIGDLRDEPDETYFVNLSAPTNAFIGDAQGLGTIVDDERNGAFSCRATGLRLIGIELGVANGPDSPCRDDAKTTLSASISALGLGVTSGTVQVSTDQTPNDIEATSPALGDKGVANARLEGLKITLGLTTITADVVTSTATVECGSPLLSAPGLTGSSQVTNLRINGNPIVVTGNAPLDINIPLVGTLHVNHQTVTGGVLTQRAIWLEGKGLLSVIQVVVSEAKADFTGNPCDE